MVVAALVVAALEAATWAASAEVISVASAAVTWEVLAEPTSAALAEATSPASAGITSALEGVISPDVVFTTTAPIVRTTCPTTRLTTAPTKCYADPKAADARLSRLQWAHLERWPPVPALPGGPNSFRRQAQRLLTQATPIRAPTPTEFEFKVLNLNLMAPPHPTLILWSSARVSSGRRYPRFHDGAITMGIEGQFAGLAVRTRLQPAFVRGGRGKGYLSD